MHICHLETIKNTIKLHINNKACRLYLKAKNCIIAFLSKDISRNNADTVEINMYIKSIKEYDEQFDDDLARKIRESVEFYNYRMKSIKWTGKIMGHCELCGKDVPFIVNKWKSGKVPWRGTLICPQCGLNSRTRRLAKELVDIMKPNSRIYITERITWFYKWLKLEFPNTIGSEYFSNSIESGYKINGVLHEDMMNLSFNEEEFDAVISCDVLEHVVDYKKAISEAHRVLRRGGVFLFSVPFRQDQYKDEIRTIIQNGKMQYLMPPEIHGNPIDPVGGALVFTIPGWEMVEYCQKIFRDISVILFCSEEKGYIGNPSGEPQVIFRMFK